MSICFAQQRDDLKWLYSLHAIRRLFFGSFVSRFCDLVDHETSPTPMRPVQQVPSGLVPDPPLQSILILLNGRWKNFVGSILSEN